MTMTYLWASLLVMALASILPRIIPMVLIKRKIKSKFIKSFLYYMPYAVLTALTFPAIIYSTGSYLTAGVGTGIALVVSFFAKDKFYLVVVISVLAVFGLSFI